VNWLGTRVWNTAAQWKIPIFPAAKHGFSRKSPLRSSSPYASTQNVHRPGSRSPLQFDMRNIYQFRTKDCFPSARRLLFAEMFERWPHIFRVKIVSTLLPKNSFVSTLKNSMKCLVNWIPTRIYVRSRNIQLHRKMCP